MFIRIFTLVMLFSISVTSFSQLSKDEKKIWKKKLKEAGPEGFKKLSDDKDQAEAEVSDLQDEVYDLEDEVKELKDDVSELESDVADYKKAAQEATEKLDSLSEGGVSMDGIVFKVQIGAYQELDLSEYFNNHKNFGGEIDDDGTMKYTLGVFRSYADAEKFKNLMRRLGVKGAWIVSYKDGKRIDIQQALQESGQG